MKLLYLLLMLFSFYPNSLAANEKIRLSSGEWPPYLSAQLPYYGVASHVVSEAFASVGVDVEYGFFPWKRSYLYAKEGKGIGDEVWNGSLVWIYTEDRAKDFLYSDRIIEDDQVLFFLKETHLDWYKMEGLRGKVLGGTTHTIYPSLEQEAKKGLFSINRADGYAALFKRLFAHRIDAIPNVKEVGAFFIRTSLTPAQQSQITHSSMVIEQREYHLIFSRKIEGNKRFLSLFNKGLKIIKENGVYDKLFQELRDGKYDQPYPVEF